MEPISILESRLFRRYSASWMDTRPAGSASRRCSAELEQLWLTLTTTKLISLGDWCWSVLSEIGYHGIYYHYYGHCGNDYYGTFVNFGAEMVAVFGHWCRSDSSQEISYDFALNFSGFEDVLSHGKGWPVLKDAEAPGGPSLESCARIAFVGKSGSGKTYVLQKLAGAELVATEFPHTPSLCWKHLNVSRTPRPRWQCPYFSRAEETNMCLLIDSKGRNKPLSFLDESAEHDSSAQDHFLRDVISEIASAFIYIVNAPGYTEQSSLLEFAARLIEKKLHDLVTVMVVHNLKHVSCKEEFAKAKKDICGMYLTQGLSMNYQPIEFMEGLLFSEGSTTNINQIHVFLAYDCADLCHENDSTISFVKERLMKLPKSNPRYGYGLQAELSCLMAKLISDYVYGEEHASELQGEIQNGVYKLIEQPNGRSLCDVNKSSPCRTHEGSAIVPNLSLGNYVKAFSQSTPTGCRVIEKQDRYVRVEIDLPAYNEEQMKKDLNEQDTSHNVLNVVDLEMGVKIMLMPDRIHDPFSPPKAVSLDPGAGQRSFADIPSITIQNPIVSRGNLIPRFQNGTVVLEARPGVRTKI